MWIEWIEPFGPANEPVFMRVKDTTAIAVQKTVAQKAKGYEYATDAQALEDFVTVNWAWRIAQVECAFCGSVCVIKKQVV